jgi:hypothetical protein
MDCPDLRRTLGKDSVTEEAIRAAVEAHQGHKVSATIGPRERTIDEVRSGIFRYTFAWMCTPCGRSWVTRGREFISGDREMAEAFSGCAAQ